MHAYRLIRSKRRTVAIEIRPNGEILVRAPRLVPRAVIERELALREEWIARHLATLPPPRPEPSEEQLAAWRKAAADHLPKRVAHFAAVMGVTPAAVKINAAAKRFGSCSSKGNLNFSCRLMAYPPEAIDYVVVHELAHLTHMNHSAAFYATVAAVLPDYKARAALLKNKR
ncbi:MAG: M48 family metallopeptidase [Ruminococcaceae bacterium]|nr:M48 family metallopeptidase [Oscillospiraceae bacterium]